MSQLFRRKPIAASMADEGSEHSLKRVLGAGELAMPAAAAETYDLAWERFGLWLAVGLTVDVADGYRYSLLRNG